LNDEDSGQTIATDGEAQGQNHETGEAPRTGVYEGLLIDQLARLPEKAILDAARLAGILRVTARTVRRMVLRNELPAPIRLAGRSVWLAGRVLAHIEAAVERAERETERQFRRTQQLSP